MSVSSGDSISRYRLLLSVILCNERKNTHSSLFLKSWSGNWKFSPLLNAAHDLILLLAMVVSELLLRNHDLSLLPAMPFAAYSMLSSEGCVALLEAPRNLAIRREEVIFQEMQKGHKAKFLVHI